MNDVLVEFLTNAVINSIAFRKGDRTHMHAPAVSFWKDKGFIIEVVDPSLTFTREDAEKLVTTNFPSETPTFATPMRAYDGDLDPAWVVLTSSNHVFLVDRVEVCKYEQTKSVVVKKGPMS